jgi:endonuclease/exonuclease/phosphatase family metal-dependent hydrolase
MVHVPFHVLVYNIMEPVPEPIRYYGQKERSERIKDVIRDLDQKHDVDVIVMNEVIAPIAQTIIFEDMEKLGFVYKTSKLTDIFTVTGGTLIFSKYPITMEDRTIFGDKCTGIDCFAAKGVCYARIKKKNRYFNVFGAHMQAWPSLKAQIVRDAQIEQIIQFMKSLNIPTDEPVFFGGDLNIDLYMSNDHIRHLMYTLSMDMPEIHAQSHPFTVDPKQNKMVGSDDPLEYYNDDFPNGCIDEYYATLVCPCCPEEWLDYTLYSKKHLIPISSSMTAINVKVPSFRMKISLNQEIDCQDVSDHFPVLGRFVFDMSEIGESEKQSHFSSSSSSRENIDLGIKDVVAKDNTSISDNTSHVTFVACMIALVILLFLMLIIWFTYSVYRKKHVKPVIKTLG